MGRRRDRQVRRLWASMVIRERAPLVLLICALLAWFGWTAAAHWDRNLAWCVRRYHHAHTAADSAAVDGMPLRARGTVTCQDLRRNGTLELYEQAEARRSASASP
jgi:hypothetical protein